MKSKKHIGSSFDSFLDDNNIRSDVEELASCKFLAIKLSEELESKGMSIAEFARKWGLRERLRQEFSILRIRV